jgi:hypothetical protein
MANLYSSLFPKDGEELTNEKGTGDLRSLINSLNERAKKVLEENELRRL